MNTNVIVRQPKKLGGFTLIELLVVISIIGLLSSVVLASLNSVRSKARDARRISDIAEIQKALELYYDKYGSYPISGACAALAVLTPDGAIVCKASQEAIGYVRQQLARPPT